MAKQKKQTLNLLPNGKYDTSIKVNAKPDELLSLLLAAPVKKKKV